MHLSKVNLQEMNTRVGTIKPRVHSNSPSFVWDCVTCMTRSIGSRSGCVILRCLPVGTGIKKWSGVNIWLSILPTVFNLSDAKFLLNNQCADFNSFHILAPMTQGKQAAGIWRGCVLQFQIWGGCFLVLEGAPVGRMSLVLSLLFFQVSKPTIAKVLLAWVQVPLHLCPHWCEQQTGY